MARQRDFEALLRTVRTAAETVRVDKAPDVEAVIALVGAMGQSFTTTMFAFQQVSQIKSNMDLLAGLAQKYPEPWVATLAGELLRRPVNTLRTRYALNGTADLYEQAAPLVSGLEPAQIVELARHLLEHHSFLARRIRDLLPFYELAVTFEGYRMMKEADTQTMGTP